MAGFSTTQAQFLIQFMRNLPGGAPPVVSDEEYALAMDAQRQDAGRTHPQTYPMYLDAYESNFDYGSLPRGNEWPYFD